MRLKTSKINEFRLWGLVFTLIGMGVMILGTAGILLWGKHGQIISGLFLFIGMIGMLISVCIYFWAGIASTSALIIECPECGKQTKMLGKTDRCMFCKTVLTLDPSYASNASNKPQQQDGNNDRFDQQTDQAT